jgi:hypothetical protein
MDAQARNQLIAALRSGQYRQIRGRFHDYGGGHCAVGLAAYIEAYPAFAPGEAGLVMVLNDRGWTFEQIADGLERGDLVASHELRRGLLSGWIEALLVAQCAKLAESALLSSSLLRQLEAQLAELGDSASPLADDLEHAPEAAALTPCKARVAHFSHDDDEPPPTAPAVIYIYPNPKRPWPASAVASLPRSWTTSLRGRAPALCS